MICPGERKTHVILRCIACQGHGRVDGRNDLESSLTFTPLARDTAIENERNNFRHLFQTTPEMVCILKGPEHVFEFVNEAHIRVLGFNATGMSVRQAQPESIEVHGIRIMILGVEITDQTEARRRINDRWTLYSGSEDPTRWLSFVHPDDMARTTEAWVHSVSTGWNRRVV